MTINWRAVAVGIGLGLSSTAVLAQSGVTSFNGRTGAVTLTSGDVTTALTYTPVNKAGDTMTGLLTLPDNLVLTNTVASNTRAVVYQTSGSSRWALAADTAAESGTSVGSNFDFDRIDNSGVFIDVPLQILRSNGQVGIYDGLQLTGNGTSTGGLTVLPTSTPYFYSSNGATVNRLNDRILLGAAAVNDAAYPNVTQDWLTQDQITEGLSNGSVVSAQAAVLTANTAAAGTALTVGAHTAPYTANGAYQEAFESFEYMDNNTYHGLGWAFYGECQDVGSVSGNQCIGMELDVRTLNAAIQPQPYQQGDHNALQLVCGAGVSATGQKNCSSALAIGANAVGGGIGWQGGINFQSGSIVSGAYGYAAIQLPVNYNIGWYNSSGQLTGLIDGTTTTASNGERIVFSDAYGMAIQNYLGTNIANLSEGGTWTANVVAANNFTRPGHSTYAALATTDPSPAVGDMLTITDASACTANTQVSAGGGTTHSCATVYNGVGWIALVTH